MNQVNFKNLSFSSININNRIIQSANIQEKNNFYFFPKHIHENAEVYYFIEGLCKMDIGKETIVGETGNIIIIFPNIVHSFYLDSNSTCKFIHIHFDLYKLASLLINKEELNIDLSSILCSINDYYKFKGNCNTIPLLYSIINDINDSNSFSETLCNLRLLELFILFIKEENISTLFSPSKSSRVPRYVLLALDYIKQNYSEKILISDIADSLNISSRYLSKLFYESTSLTIGQFLNIYRINKAIDLMNTTNNSLTDISLSVGLGDIQHFSKLFKNIIGVNPRKYKKMIFKN
ncbi:helix-turn-helix domain-containing protein [uncultured Clostridium sp.]|jgi:hypothetical protein|uniref:helix-turn-helix domain-containing protein n=1 Tax=uncultured Clostridium sp. TaxID=59620 RepID=UPI0025FF06E9|nr:AraC family transcriptional regulator [uncultured Clostridium sp.]